LRTGEVFGTLVHALNASLDPIRLFYMQDACNSNQRDLMVFARPRPAPSASVHTRLNRAPGRSPARPVRWPLDGLRVSHLRVPGGKLLRVYAVRAAGVQVGHAGLLARPFRGAVRELACQTSQLWRQSYAPLDRLRCRQSARRGLPNVRLPIPIAAFKGQGWLSQLSASSRHYRIAAISGHIGHCAREKALAINAARW